MDWMPGENNGLASEPDLRIVVRDSRAERDWRFGLCTNLHYGWFGSADEFAL
jgi:hypothetical protein